MQVQSTSRAAWRAHEPSAVNASILGVLEEIGPSGLTCDDIEALLDLDHQTASANIAHMINGTNRSHRLIEPTGEKAPTRTGRLARVLRLREEVLPPVAGTRRAPTDQPLVERPLSDVMGRLLERLRLRPSASFEVEHDLGLSHQTVSARLTELRQMGWIVDTGLRAITKNKRKAIVWGLATAWR